MNDEVVAHEIKLLQAEVVKLGKKDAATGKFSVAFGVLFDATVDIFEALGGTLKAAKKRGIISYDQPLLLKGAHDKVLIVLNVEPEAAAAAAPAAGGAGAPGK